MRVFKLSQMNVNKIFQLLFLNMIFILVMSCSLHNSTIRYERIDSLIVDISAIVDQDQLSKEFKYFKFTTQNESYQLYYLNHSNNRVYTMDLFDNAVDSIEINELAFASNKNMDLYKVSDSSYLLYSNDLQQMCVVDEDFNYQVHNFDSLFNGDHALVNIPSSRPVVFCKSFLYGSVIHFKSESVSDSKMLPIMVYNINTKEYSFVGRYPAAYSNNDYYDSYPSLCLGENNYVIYSPLACDSIYVFKNNQFYDQYCFSMEKRPEFHPFDVSKRNSQSYTKKYVLSEPRYVELFYDPYRNVYFRTFKHEVKKNTNNGILLSYDEVPWSIIIADNDFSIIGETTIDNISYPLFFIPTPKGVLISHTTFDELKETMIIKFVLYKFSFSE